MVHGPWSLVSGVNEDNEINEVNELNEINELNKVKGAHEVLKSVKSTKPMKSKKSMNSMKSMLLSMYEILRLEMRTPSPQSSPLLQVLSIGYNRISKLRAFLCATLALGFTLHGMQALSTTQHRITMGTYIHMY